MKILVTLMVALPMIMGCAAVHYPQCEQFEVGTDDRKSCESFYREYYRAERAQEFSEHCAGRLLVCTAPIHSREVQKYPWQYCRCNF